MAGNGGTIIVWSDGLTRVNGTLTARGAGNGGLIETSGHSLDFSGIRIDASARAGKAGLWLLDPYDLIVDDSAAATIDSTLNAGTGVTLQTTGGGTTGPGTANASGNGDIFIDSPISWSSGAALTLSAYRNIDINANIVVSGGGALSLTTGTGTTGDYSIAGGSSVSFTGGSGAGASFSINGMAYTLLYSMSDVQGINSGLSGHYALATSLDATSTSGWVPLGVFTGIFIDDSATRSRT